MTSTKIRKVEITVTAVARITSRSKAAAVITATALIAARLVTTINMADTSKMTVAKKTANTTAATTSFSTFVTKIDSIKTGYGTNVGLVFRDVY